MLIYRSTTATEQIIPIHLLQIFIFVVHWHFRQERNHRFLYHIVLQKQYLSNKAIGSYSIACKYSRGFTLLELLISLSIFAIISVVTFSAINYSFKVVESSKGQVERFAQVQIAWHLISQDLLQIVARPVRTDSDILAAYSENNDEYIVSFTRGGVPRLGIYPYESGLVRVSYKLEENNLYRITWPVLDRTGDTPPIRSIILTQVDAATFTSTTTQNPEDSYGGNAQQLIKMPQSITVKLTLSDLGEIERIYPGVATIVAPASTESDEDNMFQEQDAN